MKEEHMTITLKAPGQVGSRDAREEAPAPAPSPKRNKRWLRRLFLLVLVALVIALVAFGCFLLYKALSPQPAITNSSDPSQVVAAVGKLMLLPNETPTVAEVSDLSKLQGQKFFENAKQGDIVLMYAQAAQAILYSPTDNKIIQVAPIVNNQPQQ